MMYCSYMDSRVTTSGKQMKKRQTGKLGLVNWAICWRNHSMQNTKCVVSWMERWDCCIQLNRRRVYGKRLDQGTSLADLSRSSLCREQALGLKHPQNWGGHCCGHFLCIITNPHMDQRKALTFPSDPHPGDEGKGTLPFLHGFEALGSLTLPMPALYRMSYDQ